MFIGYTGDPFQSCRKFTREDLWFEADRTRVLPVQHAEAVDRELAKRANQARKKAEKAAAKAAGSEA